MVNSNSRFTVSPDLTFNDAPERPYVQLPSPRTRGGKSLLEALALRRTTREFASRPLPAQELSDLLWAASGINRPATRGDTVPKWRNVKVVDIYTFLKGFSL